MHHHDHHHYRHHRFSSTTSSWSLFGGNQHWRQGELPFGQNHITRCQRCLVWKRRLSCEWSFVMVLFFFRQMFGQIISLLSGPSGWEFNLCGCEIRQDRASRVPIALAIAEGSPTTVEGWRRVCITIKWFKGHLVAHNVMDFSNWKTVTCKMWIGCLHGSQQTCLSLKTPCTQIFQILPDVRKYCRNMEWIASHLIKSMDTNTRSDVQCLGQRDSACPHLRTNVCNVNLQCQNCVGKFCLHNSQHQT